MTEDLVKLVFGPEERSLPAAKTALSKDLKGIAASAAAPKGGKHQKKSKAKGGRGKEGGPGETGEPPPIPPMVARLRAALAGGMYRNRRYRRLLEYLVAARQEQADFGGWYRIYPVMRGRTAALYRRFLGRVLANGGAAADAVGARLGLHDVATALEGVRYRRCRAGRRECKPSNFTKVID